MDDSEEDQLDKWLAFGSSPKDQLPSFAAANPMPEASDGVNNEADDYSMILEENERRAKFGFNAAHFLTTSPLASPTVWAPCLTIPPGIDPADLLDCPIMLPNYQLSPPTGTFSLPPYNHDSSMRNLASSSTDGERASIGGSSFRFMPPGSPVSLPWLSSENQVSASCNRDQSLGADVDYQTLASGQLPFDFEIPSWFVKEAPKAYAADSHTDVHVSCSRNVNANYIASQTSQSGNGEGAGMHHVDQKGTFPSMGMTRTFEDGYNWTKYGQKKLNGGGRTYYKCTHPNCQVRKRVERSHEGQITEIIYVGGDHNHPKPQPPRWSVHGSVFSYNEMPVMGENSGSCVKIDGGSLWRNFQLGSEDIKGNSYWRADGLERTLSTSVVTELSDLFSTHKGKSICAFESAETPELSSTPASHDDDEDGETQGSISLGDDADDDGPDSKRRKKENCLIETTTSFRDFSEGRVVIQVESEVDIPNDGYRWRKYGQKAIRGSLKPRSYLKCNTAGCSVRKQVERASDDQKCVLITYDGRHNHEVPAGRNSSRVNSNAGNSPPPAPTRSTLSLPRTTNKPKNKRRVEDPAPHFERNPKFNNQFPRPPVLGNYHNDSDIGASSIYPMRFPPLQSSMLYPSFGLNSNRIGIHQPSLNAPGLPGLPSSLSLSAPRFANLASAGVDFSSHGIYSSPVRPFIAGQQPSENDMRFIRPIQEQNDGNPYDARLPAVDHASASSTSSSSSSSSSFGLNSNCIGIHQPSLNAPGLPGLPISLPSSVPRFGNLASAGVDSISHGKYSSPVRPFIAGQQPSGSDMRFFRPIQEQNDDNPYDARLPTVDHHASAASSSSIDSQMMDNFPPYIAGQQPSESDLRFIRLIQELNDDNPYDARLLTVDHHASAPSSSSSSIDSQMMDSFPPFIAGHQPSESDMRFIRPIQEQNDGNHYDARLPTADHASAPSSSSSSSSIDSQMMDSFPP